MVAAWIPLAAGAAEPRFQSFRIGDGSDSRAIAVSDDGCVLVGTGGLAAAPTHFRVEHGAIRSVRDLLGGESIGSVEGISGDGRVVVGGSDSADRAYSLEAGAVSTFWFGYETNTPDRARAISGDGALIAGDHRYGIKTMLWDRISGVPRAELLGTAVALSQDGGVAAGWYGSSAHAWTGTTPRNLGTLPGQHQSRGLGVSADGSTVVGSSGARASLPSPMDPSDRALVSR